MIISKEFDKLLGFSLTASAEEYDGVPPISRLCIDYAPKKLHADRANLAAYLTFRPWLSGNFTPPEWISPALAQVLTADMGKIWTQFSLVEFAAKSVPTGFSEISAGMVDEDTQFPSELEATNPQRLTLSILPSDRYSGALRSSRNLSVSSNAWLLARDEKRRAEMTLAVAVIMAEDLNCGIVNLHGISVCSEQLARLRRLCIPVGLTVIFEAQ